MAEEDLVNECLIIQLLDDSGEFYWVMDGHGNYCRFYLLVRSMMPNSLVGEKSNMILLDIVRLKDC